MNSQQFRSQAISSAYCKELELEHNMSQTSKSKFSSTLDQRSVNEKVLAMGSVQLEQRNEREHVSTLHAQLHQEADKIRKWKIQTELDLKGKEKKLTETYQQIEKMKKSLLELQLENEKTSAKLQEEISNRAEVVRRIDTTREMCNFLKTHTSKLEGCLSKCETERTELKYVGKENLQHFEELTGKFKNLQITAMETEKKLQNRVSFEQNDKLQKEKAMKVKIDASDGEIHRLRNEVEEKVVEIRELHISLQNQESSLKSMNESFDEIQKRAAYLSEQLALREIELNESSVKISKIQDDKSRMEEALNILEKDFHSLQAVKESLALQLNETEKKMEDQLLDALQDASNAKLQLEKEQHRLKACEAQLLEMTNLMENLKSSRDVLLLEKTDVEMQLDAQKFQVSNLMAEKSDSNEEIHRLNGEISVLTRKLDRENLCKLQVQDECEVLQGRISILELERDDNSEQLTQMQNELKSKQEKMISLESLLSEQESKTISLQAKLDGLEQKIAHDRIQMKKSEEQISELEQALTMKGNELRCKEEDLATQQNNVQDLKSVNKKLEKEGKKSASELDALKVRMKDQDNRMQELTIHIDTLTNEKEESVKSFSSHQKMATAKQKEKKELEKKLKSAKAELECQNQLNAEQKEKLETLMAEASDLKLQKDVAEEGKRRCEEDMRIAQEKCNQLQDAATRAMKEAEAMQESAKKEKEKSQALTDCRLAEMMATLDTYKKNNETNISEKDAEIQTLRAKLERTETLKVKHEKELEEYKNAFGEFTDFSAARQKDQKDLQKQKQGKVGERLEMKEKIDELEVEVSSMELQVAGHISTEKKAALSTPDTPVMDCSNKKQSTPMIMLTPQKQTMRNAGPSIPKTPKTAPLKTPQRSILRVCNSVPKRRKVVFQHGDSPLKSSSEESDLMELDTDTAIQVKSTPLLLTPSSRRLDGDKIGKSQGKAAQSRIPLNQTVNNSRKNKPHGDPVPREKYGFTEVDSNQMKKNTAYGNDNAQSKKADQGKVQNVRKAPSKLTSKFFTTSPKNKSTNRKTIKEKSQSQGTTGQLAWFDLDSVYGFGPED